MSQRNPNYAIALVVAAIILVFSVGSPQTQAQETISIDAGAPTTPFPHFWEQMFGSGHAILSLRESFRGDLRAVKKVTDFRYVRFHGILDDEVGVYNLDEHCHPVYNFSYVDQIYDGLLKNGVRPFVEISFMPKKLAANPDDLHSFWYKPNVSPPASYEKWDDLVTHFARHLVARYGINEVSQWYFEVWNEPNIDFWGGVPREASYFELYDHTARDLKGVSPRLRVGGPATAAASWVVPFLKHVAENHVPIDFVSTHGYADDTVENLFHNSNPVPMDDRVCGAIAKVKDQIHTSPMPNLSLFWTEWSVQGRDESRDTIFVGPAVANTVRECHGNVTMMSFWTFSDVFEESGVIQNAFDGGFGLRGEGGINKPSYYGFALLHQLGEKRLANASKNVIVSQAADGTLAIVAWNLADPDQHGVTRTMELDFRGVPRNANVTLQRVDRDHGNVLPKYAAMGKPTDPTPAQVEQLNRETALGPPQPSQLKDGKLELTLTPDALVLVKVTP